MRNERPCYSKYAGITLERAFRKFGELAVVAVGKIVVDFTNLFFHDMKIIDQPFRRRHDDLFFADGFGNDPIGLEQHPTILIEPPCQRPGGRGFLPHELCSRKTFSVLLEPFDAKKLASNRFFSIPRKYFSRTFKNAECGMLQLNMLSPKNELNEGRRHPLCWCYTATKMKSDGCRENRFFCPAFLSKEASFTPSHIINTTSERRNIRFYEVQRLFLFFRRSWIDFRRKLRPE